MLQPFAQEIVLYSRRLHERGFVAATDGNLSIRLPGGGFLATPSGHPKCEITAESLARIGGDGRSAGDAKPSSEWPMHLAIYATRPEVGAVVHAHPPFATSLACAGFSPGEPVLSEVVISLGTVPLIPFALPSTEALARAVAEGMANCNAALLANHGAVTVGPDIRAAYYRMETLEQASMVFLCTKLLGSASTLSPEAVSSLQEMGRKYGLAPAKQACASCPVAAGVDGVFIGRDRLEEMLIEFARLYGRTGIL